MKYAAHVVRVLFLALFLFLLVNGKAMLWLALFAISLVAAVVFGRIYCGYMCPMNTLMIPVEWLSKKLKLQKVETPGWLKSGNFPWISLAGSVLVMVLSRWLLHVDLPILPLWLAISVLVTLRYQPAVFHNLICPFGVLQRFFGKFARLSQRVNKTACIGCKLCEKVCPANAIIVSREDQKAAIDIALCHQCTDCTQVCPRQAIEYGR